MKKVLIITYYWPPSGGAGVQRWLKFTKYLRDFDWEPVIYTPENPESPANDPSLVYEIPQGILTLKTKVWEPYYLYKFFTGRKKGERIQTAFLTEKKKAGIADRISIWIRGNFFIPDARVFWIKPSIKFLNRWLKNNKIDLIVSTGPPHSMHLIARTLKQDTGIPWLADFRDPWTNIDFYNDLLLTKFADQKHHRLEKEVLRRADAITLISSGMEKQFKSIVDRKFHIITNGFDESDFKEVTEIDYQGKFILSHIGSLVKTRNVINLWKALHELSEEISGFSNDLEIRFIGTVDLSVRNSITANNLDNYVVYEKYLPHHELLQAYNRSVVLLLLINQTPNAELILTGKVFEYLAAKRPILCIGPAKGDASEIIRETHSGHMFGFEEKDSLKSQIQKLYIDFKARNIGLDSRGIKVYSRRHLTGKIVDVMNEITT